MKWSNILLIIGMIVLIAGAAMSILKMQPYSDYVLIAGAIIIILRSAIRQREKYSN